MPSGAVYRFSSQYPLDEMRADPTMSHAVTFLWAVSMLALAKGAPEDPHFLIALAALLASEDRKAISFSCWLSHLLLTSSFIVPRASSP
jgi:hypothetical protein